MCVLFPKRIQHLRYKSVLHETHDVLTLV